MFASQSLSGLSVFSLSSPAPFSFPVFEKFLSAFFFVEILGEFNEYFFVLSSFHGFGIKSGHASLVGSEQLTASLIILEIFINTLYI